MTNGKLYPNAPPPDPIYRDREPRWFLGRNVRIAFVSADGTASEDMWVNVTGFVGDRLFGVLDEEPRFLENEFKVYQTVELGRDQIQMVNQSKAEWLLDVDALRVNGSYENKFLGSPTVENGVEILLRPRNS